MTINRDLANLVPTITQSSANVGVSTTSPVAKLDVAYGDYQNAGAIRFGANIGTNTARTNTTRKFGALTTPHYTNTEENIVSISVDSESSYTALNIGGGSSSFNSPTYITFLTQAAINTGGGTEHMRIDASGNVLIGKTSPTANGGDLQVSKGITFPATQAAQSDANTLDDYEEGSWTPTIQGTSTAGTTTYTTQNGNYVKIGNCVYVNGRVTWSAQTGSGSMRLGGLPFTSAVNANFTYSSENLALTANNVTTLMQTNAVATTADLYQTPVGGGSLTNVALDTAATIWFQGFYFV